MDALAVDDDVTLGGTSLRDSFETWCGGADMTFVCGSYWYYFLFWFYVVRCILFTTRVLIK